MGLGQPQNAAATAVGLGGSQFPQPQLSHSSPSHVLMSHGHLGTLQPSLGHHGCCRDKVDTPERLYPSLGNLAGFGYHGHPWDTAAIPGTPWPPLEHHGHSQDTAAIPGKSVIPETPQPPLGHHSHPWDTTAIPGTLRSPPGHRSHPWDTVAIPGTPWSCPGHCSHPWDIIAISGTPSPP